MISYEDVRAAVQRMRRIGSDTQEIEVKEAVQGIPKSLPETICAFANHKGGTIILGLSEKRAFQPAPGFDPDKTYARLIHIGDQLTPRVHLEVAKLPYEKGTVVVACVPALSVTQKPCYVTARGKYDGSFIRTGDGDRRLTHYEIDRMSEATRQLQFDVEPVEQASLTDLNPDTLDAIVHRARTLFPRVFGKLDGSTILIQLGVLTRIEGDLRPTLAGLLAAEHFPQQYFPRLQVVFTVFPGTTKAADSVGGRRYLDSKEIIGSIPDMLLETLALVQQRMQTGAIMKGGLRMECPDYPMAAVREAVANALQHRDYSPEGRGLS